jgi:hypothetical protein
MDMLWACLEEEEAFEASLMGESLKGSLLVLLS